MRQVRMMDLSAFASSTGVRSGLRICRNATSATIAPRKIQLVADVLADRRAETFDQPEVEG
jgi:hypothetical protein